MSSLRKMVDSWTGMSQRVAPAKTDFKVNDQVVFKKSTSNRGPLTKEVIVGTVAALEAGKATVSIPRPGGRIMRANVSVNDLQPASAVYGRNTVQVNAALRQIYRG